MISTWQLFFSFVDFSPVITKQRRSKELHLAVLSGKAYTELVFVGQLEAFAIVLWCRESREGLIENENHVLSNIAAAERTSPQNAAGPGTITGTAASSPRSVLQNSCWTGSERLLEQLQGTKEKSR